MHSNTSSSGPPISWEDVNDLIFKHDSSPYKLSTTGLKDAHWGRSQDPEEELIRLHRRYIHHTTSRFILLGKVSGAEQRGREYFAVDYVVRGSDAYRRRSQLRCHRITNKWRDLKLPKGMMLTISPRATGSIWKNFQQMKDLWPKFTNWMRNRKATSGPSIWACEPTKRHYPHWHMVLARRCKKGKLAQDVLHWFQSHGVDIENPGVKVEHTRGDASYYALKYVTKGCTDKVWSSMLWLSGMRCWGASRVLGSSLINSQPEDPDKPQWELIGVCPNNLRALIMEEKPPPDEIRELCNLFSR